MPVVFLAAAVQAHADAHVQFREQVQERPVEQDAVGLYLRHEPDAGGQRRPQRPHREAEVIQPGQQGFAAVQDDLHALQAVGAGVLGDAGGHAFDDLP